MPLMLLIVGLGNPGPEYAHTRHNVGFLVADELTKRGISAKILKPDTFMNRSGDAVAKMLRQSNMGPEHILVLYDDADISFGDLRFRKGGSHGGHNGMRSILAIFPEGTDVARLKIGIGRPENPNIPLDEWVLGRWSKGEQTALPELIQKAADRAEEWMKEHAPSK